MFERDISELKDILNLAKKANESIDIPEINETIKILDTFVAFFDECVSKNAMNNIELFPRIFYTYFNLKSEEAISYNLLDDVYDRIEAAHIELREALDMLENIDGKAEDTIPKSDMYNSLLEKLKKF